MNETEVSKTYDPQQIDQKWYQRWESNNYFAPKKSDNNLPAYCIVMPPPNVTGQLHMGHALDITTQDTLIRFKRMEGYETLYLPGMDHAGIATQSVVEKLVWEQEKKTKHDYGREKFVEKIWEWKEKFGGIILHQQRAIGASADWSRALFTMGPESNQAVRKVFVDLYNQGLIYQADYIVNWDPGLQSAISDAEVEHIESKGAFYYIQYQVENSNEKVTIATTRPETLLGDTAVCVHPDDERFKHLIGKKVILPLCHRTVPIIGDNHVDIALGTGCLKVTPGHDFNDFEIGKRHNLAVINILNKDGTLNELGLEYKGMTCKNARKPLVEKLKELGILVKVEEKLQQIGHGDRSNAIIEPMVSKQWFLNVQSMAKNAIAAVQENKTTFWPKTWENTYFAWLKEPRDWCISRQLWWGHQIPVFTCASCNHTWAHEEVQEQCPKCNHKTITQDADVLDTWFSSGLWPLSTLGWPDQDRMKKLRFEKFFPTSCLVTGHDIIFFWIARMMMFSLKLVDKIPFQDVYVHAIVRDKLGRKMSKSLGNGIDPLEMTALYGADALRFTLASGSGHNRDMNLDPEKIALNRNFMNKLWNAFRFIAPFIENVPNSLPAIQKLDQQEKWIVSELNNLIQELKKSFNSYRFDDASSLLYSFTYDKFCSWFIELSKSILYRGEESQKLQRAQVLKWTFRQLTMALHPIAPFITEELWDSLKSQDEDLLIASRYPNFLQELSFPLEQEQMNLFTSCVTLIRNLRANLEIKPKDSVLISAKCHQESTLNSLKLRSKEICSITNSSNIEWLPLVSSPEESPEKSKESSIKYIAASDGNIEVRISLAEIPNIEQLKQRAEKSIFKVEKDLEKLKNKISNEKFMANAPKEVIEEVNFEKDQLMHQLETLQKNLSKFS